MFFNNFYKDIITRYCYNSNDTGSTTLQIILLTIKINKLKMHIDNNKKDNNSKKGFFFLFNKRKKFLNYLKKKKKKIYFKIIKDLNIQQ